MEEIYLKRLAQRAKQDDTLLDKLSEEVRVEVEKIDEEKTIEEPNEIEVPLGGDSEKLNELTEIINILIGNEE